MKYKVIRKLNVRQVTLVWVAYWRLWDVSVRLSLKRQVWLRDKVSLSDQETNTSKATTIGQPDYFRQIHEAVRLAGRLHFIKTACLPRSIVLADMLAARGHVAKVQLGVSKNAEQLASHAWVEVCGVMVAEPEHVEYQFTRL